VKLFFYWQIWQNKVNYRCSSRGAKDQAPEGVMKAIKFAGTVAFWLLSPALLCLVLLLMFLIQLTWGTRDLRKEKKNN